MLPRAASIAAILAVALAALGGAAPAGACACGIALEADVTRERALVIERDGEEQIVASFDLLADGDVPAAVVLPVPGEPQVEAIEEGDPLAYLDLATAPEPDFEGEDGAVAGAGGGSVDVIGREVVGGYDVTRLSADDPEALDTWLSDNGYTLPEGAAPILADYVEKGWSYVAIRLAPGEEGELKPLSVTFPAERFVYPMRLSELGTSPVDLTLYVLADGPREAKRLSVDFSGSVESLDPPPPPELEELLSAAPHLTKLTATGAEPSSFVEDVAIEEAVVPSTDDGDDGKPYWPYIVALSALLLAAGAYVLRSRKAATQDLG